MKLTAQEVYAKLINETKIIGGKGVISFTLKDIDINIESKDSVGNIIQDWIKAWLTKEGIDLRPVPNTQDFPDFWLDVPTGGLLELKSFDYDASPNFDIANFMTYRNSLLTHPYRLDSDYLIIGYKMAGSEIEIKDVWLKKVWEITGPMGNYGLNCQVKYGEIVNIRPRKWYLRSNRDRGPQFPLFTDLKSFLVGFDNTQRQWERTRRDPETSTWLTRVIRGYRVATGIDLS